MDKVDWDFVSRLEGGRTLVAYVPDPARSQSGVTIATGFDLGQRDRGDLAALGLDADLIDKLEPYLGVRRNEAAALLRDRPLTLADTEARALDMASHRSVLSRLRSNYRHAPENRANVLFTELPGDAQTVIASVAFQYGPALGRAAPRFWAAVTAQDWASAVDILEDFRDRYPTRRRAEAARLRRLL